MSEIFGVSGEEHPELVEAISASAEQTKATGDWACPGCGWERHGEPTGAFLCEACGEHGFDFDLAGTMGAAAVAAPQMRIIHLDGKIF